ncbi:MAG: hypothetical protein Q4A28_04215 [Brachymonas sp.]|nr:hypothetical protein [Brachymonas sp.]
MEEDRSLETRWLLVLLSYLFSFVGLFFTIMFLTEFVSHHNKTFLDCLMAIVWTTAWVCHIVMSAAWIKNKRLGAAWPIAGTLAGVGSFLVWFAIAEKTMGPIREIMDPTAISLAMMKKQLLMVLPCFLLALWLVHFHAFQKRPQAADEGE